VEVSDVNEASRLLREAIKDYATDPKTGRIDMDLILSGTGSHDRHIKDDRVRELKTLLLAYENSSIGWTKLMNDFNEQSDVVSVGGTSAEQYFISFSNSPLIPLQPVEAKAFEEAVETLQTQNVVKVTGDGRKRMVRRLINSDETEF
jgi:DNA replication licensing factor MCM4